LQRLRCSAAHIPVGKPVGRGGACVRPRTACAGHRCWRPARCGPRRPRRTRRPIVQSCAHRRRDRSARARSPEAARGGARGTGALLVRGVRVADRHRRPETLMSAVAARPASLATNARLALVGDVASKAAQLGVMVLASRLLSTRELAVFGICLTLATVLTVALDAGVSTVLVRECASRPRRGWASAAAAFRGRLLLALAAVAACTAGGFAFRRPVDALLVAALAILGATALTL